MRIMNIEDVKVNSVVLVGNTCSKHGNSFGWEKMTSNKKTITDNTVTYNIEVNKSKFKGLFGQGEIEGEKVILLKPETFMNLSGKSVIELMNMLKLKSSEALVISDDIDLQFADLRLRQNGSAGTHNGLRDIVARIGTDFPRIRIGAGRPEYMDLATYVLSRIPDDKMAILQEKFDKVNKVIELFVSKKTINGIDVTRL